MGCYINSHPPTPELPELLEGPETGDLCRYVYGPEDHEWNGILVRVVERSYVWGPEQHNADGTHGYRHYNWSVIEFRPPGRSVGSSRMVVNDDQLTPIRLGDKITLP